MEEGAVSGFGDYHYYDYDEVGVPSCYVHSIITITYFILIIIYHLSIFANTKLVQSRNSDGKFQSLQ